MCLKKSGRESLQLHVVDVVDGVFYHPRFPSCKLLVEALDLHMRNDNTRTHVSCRTGSKLSTRRLRTGCTR